MTEKTDQKIPRPPHDATSQTRPHGIGRRGFFGASLAMAAAGLTGGAALPAFGSEVGEERLKARYQPDSPHIKTYYHVNQLIWPEGLQHADKT